jgi:intein/homing endonuclease
VKIKLKEGKQKELILLAKGNLTWDDLSKKIDVNKEYLSRDLKNEKILISEKNYFKLCKIANNNFDYFIIKKLDDNWGKSKGGRNSSGSTIKIKIPKRSERLAELIGIILGDGNINYYKKGKKIGVYQVNIAGHKYLDKEYHLNYVTFLFKELFGVKPIEVLSKANNGRHIIVSSKQLVNFFIDNELKSGDKIKNQVTIPFWIKENSSYLKSCLRGLFDTDGCIYKLANQNSYQICFTNYNISLLNDVRNGLLSLGIGVSKITKGRDIMITKKSELRKFLNEVGFQNPRHLNKVRMWNLDKIAP